MPEPIPLRACLRVQLVGLVKSMLVQLYDLVLKRLASKTWGRRKVEWNAVVVLVISIAGGQDTVRSTLLQRNHLAASYISSCRPYSFGSLQVKASKLFIGQYTRTCLHASVRRPHLVHPKSRRNPVAHPLAKTVWPEAADHPRKCLQTCSCNGLECMCLNSRSSMNCALAMYCLATGRAANDPAGANLFGLSPRSAC